MSMFRRVLPFLLIALVMAALISPFASSLPDGLERVAEILGFDDHADTEPILSSPLPDYSIPSMGESPLGTVIAGTTGTLVCFFLPFTFYLLCKK